MERPVRPEEALQELNLGLFNGTFYLQTTHTPATHGLYRQWSYLMGQRGVCVAQETQVCEMSGVVYLPHQNCSSCSIVTNFFPCKWIFCCLLKTLRSWLKHLSNDSKDYRKWAHSGGAAPRGGCMNMYCFCHTVSFDSTTEDIKPCTQWQKSTVSCDD